MKLVKELVALNEVSTVVDFSKNEKFREKLLKSILVMTESKLPTSCRFKSFDTRFDRQEVEWVTQSSEPEESQKAAEIIAKAISEYGFVGWTVKVVCRDLLSRNNTPWQTALSKHATTAPDSNDDYSVTDIHHNPDDLSVLVVGRDNQRQLASKEYFGINVVFGRDGHVELVTNDEIAAWQAKHLRSMIIDTAKKAIDQDPDSASYYKELGYK